MATTHGVARTVWRKIGAAAVAFAGAVLTGLCVVSWMVKFDIVEIANFIDPHWFLLIFLTLGSLALLVEGIRDFVHH